MEDKLAECYDFVKVYIYNDVISLRPSILNIGKLYLSTENQIFKDSRKYRYIFGVRVKILISSGQTYMLYAPSLVEKELSGTTVVSIVKDLGFVVQEDGLGKYVECQR